MACFSSLIGRSRFFLGSSFLTCRALSSLAACGAESQDGIADFCSKGWVAPRGPVNEADSDEPRAASSKGGQLLAIPRCLWGWLWKGPQELGFPEPHRQL